MKPKYSSNFIYNSAVQPTKLIHKTFPPHWQLLRFRDWKYVIGVHAINQRLAASNCLPDLRSFLAAHPRVEAYARTGPERILAAAVTDLT